MQLRGVIFDLDGTLVDSGLDFQAIRREMGLGSEPILEAMSLLDDDHRSRCEEILQRHETEGALRATLLEGAREWIEFLDNAELPRAIFTRNARVSVDLTLDRCQIPFDHVIARDDAPPKPDPTAIAQICTQWGVSPENVLMIGDYVYDLLAGRAAGAQTALVTHGRTWEFEHLADFVWHSLDEGLNWLKHHRSGLA